MSEFTLTADELLAMLTHEVHAPASTHSPYDGSCSECPWPLHQLPLEDMARELAAMLYERSLAAIRADDAGREETDRG